MKKPFLSIGLWFLVASCQDSAQLCGRWKLDKLTLPGITYDLSDQKSSKVIFLKALPKNLSHEDSVAYLKSFDEHIHDMKGMYLLLRKDSTYETNTVLESQKIHRGRFSFNPQTKILVFSADPNSISGRFQVITLDKSVLILSEITPDIKSSMSFKKKD